MCRDINSPLSVAERVNHYKIQAAEAELEIAKWTHKLETANIYLQSELRMSS